MTKIMIDMYILGALLAIAIGIIVLIAMKQQKK